jgi:hypothetical protein
MDAGCLWKRGSQSTPPPPKPTDPPATVVGSHSAFDTSFTGLLTLYALTLYFYSRIRYKEKKDLNKKFILRLSAFLTLGLAFHGLLPTRFFQEIITLLSSSALSIMGVKALAAQKSLFITVREGGYYLIFITPYCVGWGPILNYAALVFSLPEVKIMKRVKGIFYGLPLVAFLNFVKVPLEGLLAHYYGNRAWISQVDLIFANGLLLAVYVTWAYWTKLQFCSSADLIWKRLPKGMERTAIS